MSNVFKLQSLFNHIQSTNKTIQMDAAELLIILIEKSSGEEVLINNVRDILQALTGDQYLLFLLISLFVKTNTYILIYN